MKSADSVSCVLTLGIHDEEIKILKESVPDCSFIKTDGSDFFIDENIVCIIVESGLITDKIIKKLDSSVNDKARYIPWIVYGNSNAELIAEIERFFFSDIEILRRPIDIDVTRALLRSNFSVYHLRNKYKNVEQNNTFLQKKAWDRERRLKILSAAVNEPIIFVSDDLKVQFWNKQAHNVFGYSKFEIITEDILRWIIAPKSHSLIKEIVKAASSSGTRLVNFDQTFFVRTKLGLEFEMSATISYHELYMGSFNLVFVFHDVLKEKKLEKETIKNRELWEENKVLREFIYTVSHDLRTPLNAILGISKTLGKYNSGNLTDRQREGLDIIYQSGNDMASLVRDLLELVKMERGRYELHEELIDFDKFLALQKSQALFLIDKKPIKFSIKRSASVPPSLICDSRKLGQILNNLLSNAVKYTNRGKIILSMHLIGNKLFFEVADTGIGISKDKLHLLTAKFIQDDSPYTANGIGLGLHISKKLIQTMSGEINIESRVGEGTVIRFYISLSDKSLKAIPEERKIPQTFDNPLVLNYNDNKKIILAIDDSDNNAYIYSLLSEMEDYAFLIARNGKIGLNAIKNLTPDIIILNFEVPELHGSSLIREIKREKLNLPLMVFSNFENFSMDLPEGTIIIPQPLSVENITNCINDLQLSPVRKKIVKICFVYEENSKFSDRHRNNPDYLFIQNKNCALSYMQICRGEIGYLIFEEVLSENNNELIFTLIDNGNCDNFREIILLHEGKPMKFLKEKIKTCTNIRLNPYSNFKLEDLY